MKTLKVVALTGGLDVPSARFRVRQYKGELLLHNIKLKEYYPTIRQQIRLPGLLAKVRRRYIVPWLFFQMAANLVGRIPAIVGARNADIVLINRSVIPGFEESVNLLPRPRILDVDDSIWLTDPRGENSAVMLARRVDAIIAGNDYIANYYKKYNENIFTLPTVVDNKKYAPRFSCKNVPKKTCTIGWIGTSGNFKNLELVREVIMDILDKLPYVRMLIVADKRPDDWYFKNDRVIFRKWCEENEVDDLREMDIGLMPLHDNEWNRGKCSFKMLQYLAVGIPVVVSPVGMNCKILSCNNIGLGPKNTQEWTQAILTLCKDIKTREEYGKNGINLVNEHYSVRTNAKLLKQILDKVFHNNLDQ